MKKIDLKRVNGTEHCETCGKPKKDFMHNCSETATMEEIYGCPDCDDVCGFCRDK